MSNERDEDDQLRAVTLRNMRSIFLARQRAEEELFRAKEELQQQSEWLRVTLASIGDAVATTDAHGNVLSLNAVAEELTGWSQQEAQGRPLDEVFRIVNEETRRLAESPAARVLREGHVVGLANHTLLISRDGRETPIDDSAAPIRDENDRIRGVVLIFRSIAEQRLAERAQARLAAIVESSQDAIISKTLEGRIVSWNAAAEQLLGYRADEAIGKPVTLLFPPERYDEENMILERLRRGERIEHYETVRVTKDGRRIDVSLSISPVRDASGKIVAASKILRDITERKQTERTTRFLADASAALAELTDYKSTLQKVAALAVPFFADWCTVDMRDADGTLRRLAVTHSDPEKVRLANELFRRYPPRASDVHGVMKVLRTGESEWAPRIADALLAETARDAEHLRIVRELGLKSYVCTPLRSHSGTIGVMTFVTAESGRVYRETDLAAAEDLARRAVIAIENATLVAALKIADRRKDEFLAMLAHELRNPLAPIRNAVTIFRGRDLPAPDLRWATDVIDRQLQQLTRLVDDLLDMSRITQGKIEIRSEVVELAEVLQSAIEASRPLIEERGHALTVTIAPSPSVLKADPIRLAQVFLNLLNNAARYTERGGRIEVIAENGADQVTVRVRDNGIGIAPEMLPRVFDLFTRGERFVQPATGGLGIGLTLVKRLVALHGGMIEAHSGGPGQGSEFVVRLPAAPAAAKNRPAAKAGENSVKAAARRILVVDDNRDAAESLAMLLRMMGNEVHLAYDGLEAVELAATRRPDAILLDIGLPKLSGYDAAHRIRKQEAGGRVLLIALSGWGQNEDRRRSREAGFDHHLVKPVDFDTLQKLLAEARS